MCRGGSSHDHEADHHRLLLLFFCFVFLFPHPLLSSTFSHVMSVLSFSSPFLISLSPLIFALFFALPFSLGVFSLPSGFGTSLRRGVPWMEKGNKGWCRQFVALWCNHLRPFSACVAVICRLCCCSWFSYGTRHALIWRFPRLAPVFFSVCARGRGKNWRRVFVAERPGDISRR